MLHMAHSRTLLLLLLLLQHLLRRDPNAAHVPSCNCGRSNVQHLRDFIQEQSNIRAHGVACGRGGQRPCEGHATLHHEQLRGHFLAEAAAAAAAAVDAAAAPLQTCCL
jgi:hypothetical protein